MSIMWKLLVLFGIWIVGGFITLIVNVITWCYKTTNLNVEDEDDVIDEMINLLTWNIFNFKKDENFKERMTRINNFSEGKVWTHYIEAAIEWPKYLAIINSRYSEAYKILKDKYGLKPVETNDDKAS